MTAAARPFEGRVNLVLAKFPLQLEQVFQCVLVVGINGHPLGALCLWVQRIKTDCHPAIEVVADCSEGQAPVALWTIVIMLAVVSWSRRLHSVGKPIDK